MVNMYSTPTEPIDNRRTNWTRNALSLPAPEIHVFVVTWVDGGSRSERNPGGHPGCRASRNVLITRRALATAVHGMNDDD